MLSRSGIRSGALSAFLGLLSGFPTGAGEGPVAPPPSVTNLAEAEQAMVEGQALARQETAASQQLAAEKLRNAAEFFRVAGEPGREALALTDLGEIYEALGEPARALASAERALELRRQLGDSGETASSLRQLGLAALDTGDHERALTSLQEALHLFRSQQDRRGEAAALNGLGRVHDSLEHREAAQIAYDEALATSRFARDRREEASILNNLGMLSYRSGDAENALRRFEEALPLMESEGLKRGQATVLNNLGLASEALGNKQQAADSYQSLLPVARALGDPLMEAAIRNNLGTVLRDMGAAEQALEQYQGALAIWRGAKQTAYEAVALNNMGAVFHSLGEWDLAVEHFHQSLLLRRAVQDRRGEATALSNIADVLTRQGDLRKALDFQVQALAVFREVGNRRNEAGVLNNMGRTRSASGEHGKALELYLQAEAIRREIGDRQGLSTTLHNLGTVYRSRGEMEKAQRAYAEGLSLAEEVGDLPGEASIRLGRSRLLQETGNPETALAEIRQAVEILESRRKLTNSQNLRNTLFVALREYYDQYLDLLIDLRSSGTSPDSGALALEVSERARSRGLLDTLLEAQAEIRRGVEPELLESERQLQGRINLKELEWKRLLSERSAPDGSDHRRREMDELLRQLDEVRSKIRARSPVYAELTQPEPLRLPGIQALLGADTVLLSYYLGREKSFVCAVTPSSLTVRELPPREEVESAARELHSLLSRSDRRLARRPTEQAAGRLAGMVLGPVGALLGRSRLVIVADGALHYVPFANLPAPGRPHLPLAAEHEIVSLPSASVLAVLRRPRAGRETAATTVAILADPVFGADDPRVKLPAGARMPAPPTWSTPVQRAGRDVGLGGFARLLSTREEAEAIASLAPQGQFLKALDFDASKQAAVDGRLAGYRVIHLATHGLLDTRRPELSGVVLSLVDPAGRPQDGFLRLHEIYNLNLPSDLVVLSGCETALGKEVRGEGLIALTRGFMHAGARAVIASLWRVDDRTTAELMRRFYRALLRQGLPPAAALRSAQVSMAREEATAAPYFWAGFVYQGDWASARPTW